MGKIRYDSNVFFVTSLLLLKPVEAFASKCKKIFLIQDKRTIEIKIIQYLR